MSAVVPFEEGDSSRLRYVVDNGSAIVRNIVLEGEGTIPSLVLDPSGTAHVLARATFFGSSVDGDIVAWRIPPSGPAEGPVTVAAANADVGFPQAVLDPAGSPLAVWQRCGPCYPASTTINHHFEHARFVSGSWTASDGPAAQGDPGFFTLASAAGRVLLAYQEKRDSSVRALAYRDGAWGAEEMVSTTAGGPNRVPMVAVSESGEAAILMPHRKFFTQAPGATWQEGPDFPVFTNCGTGGADALPVAFAGDVAVGLAARDIGGGCDPAQLVAYRLGSDGSPPPTTSSTTTTTTTTTLPPPPPPVDRYAITSYDRMAPGAPHNGYFVSAFQGFTAQSNRITYLGVTVGTPNYAGNQTVRIRLCPNSTCTQVLAEANPQIVNYGNSFADIGDVAVTPGQQYFIVWNQPARWNGQTWVTYWWAGGNTIVTSDQMQAVVKGFNAPGGPPPPPPPPANSYKIETDGRCAAVRTGPGTQFQSVACLANGTNIVIECQIRGGPAATNDGRVSEIWDRLSSPQAGNYVSDILVNTPAFNDFSPGIPVCPGSPPTPPPTAGYDCEAFVADLTIPDGTRVSPNTTFVKVWRLRNCGTTDWSDLQAVRVAGVFGPTSFPVPRTAPGATADVQVAMTAPGTQGSYRTTYRLTGPRGLADQPGGFWVAINVAIGASPPPPPPPTQPPPPPSPGAIKYVALGDSFSSGEGNPPFDANSDTPTNRCHRSSAAYPRSVARSTSVNLTLRACSGATTENFYISQYPDQGAQLSYLTHDTQLVTVTIGGNDVGFATIAAGCVTFNCIQREEEIIYKIAVYERQWSQLFSRIRRATSPTTKILVMGYPQIFPDPGRVNTTGCGATGSMDSGSLLFLREKTRQLNDAIARAASAAGVTFVDAIPSFAGHELCTSQPWFTRLTLFPTVYSFHPNVSGHGGYARLVRSHI